MKTNIEFKLGNPVNHPNDWEGFNNLLWNIGGEDIPIECLSSFFEYKMGVKIIIHNEWIGKSYQSLDRFFIEFETEEQKVEFILRYL